MLLTRHGRRGCGGLLLPDENGFAQTAQEHGPEPAKKQRSRQTAEGSIQQDAVRATVSQPAGGAGKGEAEDSS